MVTLFASRTIEKSYLAITLGAPYVSSISNFLGRDPHHRQKMAVVEKGGKEAHTNIEIVAHNEELALLRLFPKTGRTHQLRVHLQFLNCPILGDVLYGSQRRNKHYQVASQLLHAHTLRFIHPVTKEALFLTAPLPEIMKNFLKKISQKLFL
jgi:23S rRNA pseudouridine1911/1915/1917 synthase